MPLNIIIAGGGIGGLAAAAGFRQDGHHVTVFEQAKALSEVGAAIGLGPNAMGSLQRLGVRERLAAEAVRPRAWTHRRWIDGSLLGAYDLHGSAEARFGHPFWMVHRGDLYNALLQGAVDPNLAGAPADLRLGERIVAVHNGDDYAEVESADGKRYRGDLVIGADGVRSRVRESLFGRDEPIFSGNAVVRVQLPTQYMLTVPELKPFVEDESIETWLGPGAHILHAPISAGRIFNFSVCFTDNAIGPETWFTLGNKADLLEKVNGWFPPILEIIERGELVGRWDVYDRDPLETWFLGRTVLIGDAAHPMIPYLGQGGAQTLEDAVALVDVLRDATPSDIPTALVRYEEFRKPRAQRVQKSSRDKRDIYHLSDGLEQRARDAADGGKGDLNDFNWVWQLPEAPGRRAAGSQRI